MEPIFDPFSALCIDPFSALVASDERQVDLAAAGRGKGVGRGITAQKPLRTFPDALLSDACPQEIVNVNDADRHALLHDEKRRDG